MRSSDNPLAAPNHRNGLSRRDLISGAALLGLGVGLDHALAGQPSSRPDRPEEASVVPFYGPHQAGIATPAQSYLHFAAFDLTSHATADLISLLKRWTAASAVLTGGLKYDPAAQSEDEAPSDTGEALEIGAAHLTLTFGFGASLFGSTPADPLGLAHVRPKALQRLPPFQGDEIDPTQSEGDLCVQACADDPQVAFHAVHVLCRLANAVATLRWTQVGFGRTSNTTRKQHTPRNLMGFKDGTNNIRAEEADLLREHVWVQGSDRPTWMQHGTYLIARRIRILFDVWDSTSLSGQQRAVGRDKNTGAPLGARAEYDPVDLRAEKDGELDIPIDAHIRLASPSNNAQHRILRRGYSYTEPTEPGTGQIDAGLFFICFQRDPARQFVPLQRRLAENDALSRHTIHTTSSIFACPPGIAPGSFIGSQLFRSPDPR